MLKIFKSSVNPDKISLTLKGLIPLIIFLGTLKGVSVSGAELNDTVEAIVSAISVIGVSIASVITAWGAIRKIVVKFKIK